MGRSVNRFRKRLCFYCIFLSDRKRLAGLVFYLALAVNHCSPEPERDAICLVGVAAIAAGGTTTSAGAAGTHATCNLGRKRQFIQRLEEMQEGPEICECCECCVTCRSALQGLQPREQSIQSESQTSSCRKHNHLFNFL